MQQEQTPTKQSSEQNSAISTKKPKVEPRKPRPNVARWVGFILLAFLAGFVGSWYESQVNLDLNPLTVLSSQDDGNSIVTANEESIAAVAKKVSPSVVSILSTTTQTSFFNQTYDQQAAGTGMIVSKDGYILTNKHVVDGADKVTVVLPSGKTYKDVEVLGTDPLNDVAFLKIDGVTNLSTVTLGDSKTVRIGQTVVAIGNALGQYQNTVTSGIISGLGRPVVAGSESGDGSESLNDLLQTDAAINSGNSGGPLLNLKGQVIGINTAIAANAQNLGFSIPIGATKGMLAHLIRTGKLERPYLGIQYISITPEVKEEYNLPVARGDYVFATEGPSVQRGGPADKAGVKNKDIIIKVNGVDVGPGSSVATLISEYEPGSTVQLTVLRNGQAVDLKATLGVYEG